MNRHSPSRNQRSKGIKIKQILQICVLVAISLWLIYQVKHSHDKKKEFEANDAKITLNLRRQNDISKLGRKDLLPRVEEESRTEEDEIEEEKEEEVKIEEKDETEEETKNGDKDELDGGLKNEENDEQDDEIKNEDKDEQEEEIKNEEKDEQEGETEEREGEERDSGKDGIDERDEEDKETEEGEEKESELKEGEENKDVLAENEVSLVDHDRDEGNENTHEAREEQYKADDASSAVTHDDSTEKVNGEVKHLDQENKVNYTEEVNTGQNGTEVELGNNQPGENRTEVDMGDSQLAQNGTEVEIGNSQPSQNDTSLIMEATNVQEPNNNTVESQTTTNGETYNLQSTDMEQGNDTNIVSDDNQMYSNLTLKESAVLSNTATNLTNSNGHDEAENKEHSSSTDEILESNTDQIQHDQMDSTIPLEEKEVRTDLDTLPEIRTERTNSEYSAAE